MKQRYDIDVYAAPHLSESRPFPEDQPAPPLATNWGAVVISGNLFFAMIVLSGLLWEGRSIALSIIASGLYYAITTIAVLSLVSGQAASIWREWQRERTERERIHAYEYLAERKMEIDAIGQRQVLPVEGVQGVLPDGDTYVPPYTSETLSEAIAWLTGLYGSDGYLLKHRIRGGYVQGNVIGSKRTKGGEAANRLLIAYRVIKPAEGGYKFNVRAFPTITEVDALKHKLQTVLGGRAGGNPRG